jgi:hypothetical protein
LFLEFGHSAALRFIIQIKIIGTEKPAEEGDYEHELDSEGPEKST